ncbi:hypothetical protein B5F07_04050 [Lachnoclostridium sp. An169]|nr:hypothetical protein B5F07_04050 [Lachnoclostridium sp. An169]
MPGGGQKSLSMEIIRLPVEALIKVKSEHADRSLLYMPEGIYSRFLCGKKPECVKGHENSNRNRKDDTGWTEHYREIQRQ